MLLQGYNNLVKDIFEEAGLLKSQKVKLPLLEATTAADTHTSLHKCSEVTIFTIEIIATEMYEQLITSLLKLYIFSTQDLKKQREEIERLRALLIQHNISFEPEQSKRTYLAAFQLSNITILLFCLCRMSQTCPKTPWAPPLRIPT